MKTESHTTRNKEEIDQIEADLKRNGYRQVSVTEKLQPGEYYRNKWTGTSKSFEGQLNYHIEWCRRE